jgi:hypothetical protein
MTLVLKNLNAHKNMKINKNELLIFRGNLKKKKNGLVDCGLKQSQKQGVPHIGAPRPEARNGGPNIQCSQA